MLTQKSNGNFCISNNIDHCDMDSGRIKYRQVGTIQLMRGNRFVISLDEHRLPEGTRALYVRELIRSPESDGSTDSGNDGSNATSDFDSW